MFKDPIYFFLPMILFLGVITTYEDLKFGKIRNKWIIFSLEYALVMNIILFFLVQYFSPGDKIRAAYFIELFVSLIISFILGYILWNIGLWTAGDAKLFVAFTALIPLSVYKYGYAPFIAPTNILINTMVPFFLIFTVILIFKTSIKQKTFYLKKSLEPKQLGSLFVFLFALIWPIRLFVQAFGIPDNYFLTIFYLFLLLYTLERIFKLNLLYVAITLSILRLFFDPIVFTASQMIMLCWVYVSFVFLRFFILYMAYDILTRNIDLNLLKKGMVPAQRIYKENGKYKKEESLFFSLINYLDAKAKPNPKKVKYIFGFKAEGLDEDDIKAIRKAEKNIDFEHLKVYKTMAFAPFLFAGVILTIIFSGNLFLVLAYLLL